MTVGRRRFYSLQGRPRVRHGDSRFPHGDGGMPVDKPNGRHHCLMGDSDPTQHVGQLALLSWPTQEVSRLGIGLAGPLAIR
jgi:hypothetical protein